jgi:hypothetical protein
MKDVAYFLGSCLDSAELETNADQLLDYYFRELETVIQETDSEASFHELEQEWRRLYPVAWTDFTRFMLGWMPTHQKVNEYSLKLMNSVLESMQ